MGAASGSVDNRGAQAYAQRRQAALDGYRILDTGSEQAFDDLVKLASTICGTRRAAISLIDRDRQWFKARIGLDGSETARGDAICDHAIRQPERVMEVDDVRADPRFSGNALIRAENIGFYAGAPILSADGYPIGTLCVFDDAARALQPAQREALATLARQAQHLLELHKLLDHQRSQIDDSERDRAELLRRHDDLRHVARHDPLTGLLNRNALDELLARADVVDWMRHHAFGLLLLDIDHFKRINDTLGHLHGDEVLRLVAAAVRSCVRANDIALRYGGEEILVVFPDTAMADMRDIAERIRERIAGLDPGHPLTVSMGMALAAPGADPNQVFARTDQALYRAKALGRDQLVVDPG